MEIAEMANQNLLVIVPAFNEEKSIVATIEDIRLNLSDGFILVINDGSNDSTKELCEDLGVKVLSLPFNCGIGAALKTGLMYGIKNTFKTMLIFDGDGQHKALEAHKILSKVSDENIVLGYRMYEEYKFSITRKTAHKILVLLLKVRSNIEISDPTSGFRAFSFSAAKKLVSHIESEYLADTVGTLQVAATYKIEILEVPVTMSLRMQGTPSNRGFKLAKRFILASLQVLFGRHHQ